MADDRRRRGLQFLWPVLATAVITSALVSMAGTMGAAQSPGPTPTATPSAVPSPSPTAGATPSAVATPSLGRILYLRDCAWCHGQDGSGARFGPSLIGVGAESADFMLSTGRMPIPAIEEQPPRRPPAYSHAQIAALVDFVASLGPGPAIPPVDPAAGDIGQGAVLYEENCAACHSSTGVGGALTSGLEAPTLMDSTARQIVEAMRLGGAGLRSGKMPKFGTDAISEQQANSLVRYILYLQHPKDRGGASLARIGPVAEGFVAWVGAMVLLVLFVRWIGKKTA